MNLKITNRFQMKYQAYEIVIPEEPTLGTYELFTGQQFCLLSACVCLLSSSTQRSVHDVPAHLQLCVLGLETDGSWLNELNAQLMRKPQQQSAGSSAALYLSALLEGLGLGWKQTLIMMIDNYYWLFIITVKYYWKNIDLLPRTVIYFSYVGHDMIICLPKNWLKVLLCS